MSPLSCHHATMLRTFIGTPPIPSVYMLIITFGDSDVLYNWMLLINPSNGSTFEVVPSPSPIWVIGAIMGEMLTEAGVVPTRRPFT